MLKKLRKQKKVKVTDLDLEERVEREWKYLRKIYIKDEDHLLFVSFIFVVVGLIVVLTLLLINHVPKIQQIVVYDKQSVAPTKVLSSGQEARSSVYTIKISNVTENGNQDRAFAYPDDYTMLIMDFAITNNSSATQNFIPVTQLYVRSTDGISYPFHASMFVKKAVEFQHLNPGETQSGQISFAVPKTLAYPLLYVDLGWDDYVPVLFSPLK